MRKTKLFKFTFFAPLFVSLLFSLTPLFALAQSGNGCNGFSNAFNFTSYINGKATTTNAVAGLPQTFCTATDLISFAIKMLLGFAGTVAVLFIVVGGFWYLTASGNEEQSEKGRKTIINAVIGLVVIIMAFAIVQIIGNLLTSGGGSSSSGTSNPSVNVTNPNPSPDTGAGNSNSNNNNLVAQVTVNALDTVFVDSQYVFTATVPTSLITCGALSSNSAELYLKDAAGSDRKVIASSIESSGANPTFNFLGPTPQNLGYIVLNNQAKSMHVSLLVCGTERFSTDVTIKPPLQTR